MIWEIIHHLLIFTHHFNRFSVLSSSLCQCKTSIWICPISIISIFQASNWTVSSIGWRRDTESSRLKTELVTPADILCDYASASCQSPDTHDMKWRGFAINNPLITRRLANSSACNVTLRIKYSKHCKISEVNITGHSEQLYSLLVAAFIRHLSMIMPEFICCFSLKLLISWTKLR